MYNVQFRKYSIFQNLKNLVEFGEIWACMRCQCNSCKSIACFFLYVEHWIKVKVVRGAPPPHTKKNFFWGRFLPNVGGWGDWFPNKVQTHKKNPTRISPFVFTNLTKTLGWVHTFGKTFPKKWFLFWTASHFKICLYLSRNVEICHFWSWNDKIRHLSWMPKKSEHTI